MPSSDAIVSQPLIQLTQEGSLALIKPQGFLGGDLFGTFRQAIEGASYDGKRRLNVASLDKVPAILRRLRECDFDVSVSPELAASLKTHTAQLWADLKGSAERADAVDAILKQKGLGLYPFQRIGVKWLATRYGALLADQPGLGKQQPVDTNVLTPQGWRHMGSLRVGDEVIGSNGRSVRVLGVFPQGVKPSYRVTFSDHTSVEAGPEHLWTVAYKKGGRCMHEITVTTEQLKSDSVIKTHWASGLVTRMAVAKTILFLPMLSAPVRFAPVKLSIPSYLLGQMIANGSLAHGSPSITICTDDYEEIRASLLADDVVIGAVHVYGNATRVGFLGMIPAVKALGLNVLSGEKRIPAVYLRASAKERIALLQGLMDGNGSCSATRNKVHYHTTSEDLADDVQELVELLGGIASIRAYDRTHEDKGTDYQVRIKLPPEISPFRTRRKSSRLISPRRGPVRTVSKVEYVREVESVCISVDADDQLYVTEHGILTHNTIQSLSALPANAAVLVVAPAVAKGVWKREVARWRPNLTAVILEGRQSFRWPEPGEVVIINYDILPEAHDKVCKNMLCPGCGPGLAVEKSCPEEVCVIADEAHALKSGKAMRTRKFRLISYLARKRHGRVWLLTGTPLLNRPQELWNIYQAAGIAQEAFGSWNAFVDFFNGTPQFYGGFEWGTPHAEVPERIRRVCLRRMTSDVLPDLPRKTWREVTVDIDKATLKKCDKLLKEYGGLAKIVHLIEKEGLSFETMSAIRQALAVAKIPAALAMVADFEAQDEPLVVFSAHRAVVEELGKREGWATIMGGTPNEERTRIEEDFQAGKLKGIAGTIQAAGVAITLTRAHNVLFTDREWTPALNAQAEDRCARIGQKTAVVITTLMANHELDERITELLMDKQRLITATVDEARTVDTAPQQVEDEVRVMVEAAEEEVRLALLPREELVDVVKPKSKWRQPETEEEAWAKQGLMRLVTLDPDRATEQNEVGFNSVDGGIGHNLARQLGERNGLTNAQWALVIRLLVKYHGQIGHCPNTENDMGEHVA